MNDGPVNEAEGPSRGDDTPLVCVGIPVFNGERYLREAIDSVLSQEGIDFELVIADNHSTDGTRAICEAYAAKDPRVRYHRHPGNIGLGRNFKSCVELASSRYFCWLAHDDLFASPRFLADQVSFLESHPDVALCGSAVRIFDDVCPTDTSDHVLEAIAQDREWREARLDFFRWPQPPFHGLVIYGVYRREHLLRVPLEGRMHRGKQVAMDMEYPILANLCRYGRIVALPQVLKLSRSVSSSEACRQMELFTSSDYLWLGIGARLTLLKIAWQMPCPLDEKLELLAVAVRNFGRAQLGQRPRFTATLATLRGEVAILRKTCAERLELIQKLDSNLNLQVKRVQSLKEQLQQKAAELEGKTRAN